MTTAQVFLKRFLAYVFLGVALALLFGSFTGVTVKKGANATKHIRTYHLGPGGNVSRGSFTTMDITVPAKIRISWFNPARYSLGLVFLLLGLGFARQLGRSLPGIRLIPRWASTMGDGFFIAFIAFGAFLILDTLMVIVVGMRPALRYDRGIFYLMAVAFFPVTAFFAWFATQLMGQSLAVTPEEVIVYTYGKPDPIPWKDIRGFKLKETYVAVERIGILMPRKLQTKLVIQTTRGAIEFVEAGSKKIKERIIRKLERNAPGRLKGDIASVGERW